MDSATLTVVLQELRKQFEQLYGERLSRMILYGSRARGDADPDSDIDILVVLHGAVDEEEETARCAEMISDLCLQHNVVVSCVFMDEEYFTSRQGPFLRNVRREGILV